MKIISQYLKKSTFQVIFGFLGLCFLFSCGASVVPIKYGKIVTEGVEIRGIDTDFVLESGDNWQPPFYSDMEDMGDQRRLGKNITGEYTFALKHMDAQKVRVKTPYLEKDLYGVLVLNKAFKGCEGGPVTRSYQISVPREYAEQALNGKISVLYEYYDCKGNSNVKTWILWMSDVPF